MADIWRNLLGLKRVGLHDNFFDLGGHSLLIVRLINEIRLTLGVTLGAIDILQNQTVEMLAHLIAEQLPMTKHELRITQLQKGTTAPRLYFIHAGPDEAGLAELMGPGHAIFAIAVPWPLAWRRAVAAHRRSAMPNIDQVVAPYVTAIKAHLGSSLCVIAGHSHAGTIAVELARQLQNQGGRVEAVILFDTLARLPSFSEVVGTFCDAIGSRS